MTRCDHAPRRSPTRTIRARGLFGLVVLVALLAGVSPARAQNSEAITIAIMDHQFDVVPDETLRIAIRIRGSVPRGAQIVVRASGVLTQRDQITEVLDGGLGPTLDRVTLALDDLERTRDGDLVLDIPTTSGPLRQGVLRLWPPGLHPLRIEVRAPTPETEPPLLGSVTTLAQAVDPAGMPALDIAYVAEVSSPPVLEPDATLRIAPETLDALDDLVASLEAHPGAWTLGIAPELLDALGSTPATTVTRDALVAAIGSRQLLAVPAVSMDPSAAARDGLVDTYTSLLRRGEDLVGALVGRGRVTRAVSLVSGPLDAGGALLLRDLGAQGLVLTPLALRANATAFDPEVRRDPTQLVTVPVTTEVDLPAALVDPVLADLVDVDLSGTDRADRLEWSLRVVAEMLMLRQQSLAALGAIEDPGAAAAVLARRSLVITTPHGDPMPAENLALLGERLDSTPGLDTVTLAEAMAQTDVGIVNGLAAELDLPNRAGGDLAWLAEQLYAIELDTSSVGSMLPPEDPRPRRWEEIAWRAAAAELDQNAVTDRLDVIRADLDEIRAAVASPPVSDVTLAGRRSTIRLKLRNEAEVPLAVTVRLESPKLSFPDGQQLVELPARQVTEVDVPVEVRSNGRFPVSVTLLTPEGEVPLHPPVEFAARANALTGLGQVVTVAGGLVLASWWIRHLRARRRDRSTTPAA